MFIITQQTYSNDGELSGCVNIVACTTFERAEKYLDEILLEISDSDRDFSMHRTGDGFIVTYNDGLKLEQYYRMHRITVKD